MEQSNPEASQNLEFNANQPKSHPMARAPSNDNSCSAPSPSLSAQRVFTPSRRNSEAQRSTFTLDSPPLSPPQSLPSTPNMEKPGVRFVNSRVSEAKNRRPMAYRPFSNEELSAVDQKWGRLFDGNRNPTPRLGQFLRGLANLIIAEFQPKNSIIITPDKMATFYAEHTVENEAYDLIRKWRHLS